MDKRIWLNMWMPTKDRTLRGEEPWIYMTYSSYSVARIRSVSNDINILSARIPMSWLGKSVLICGVRQEFRLS